MKKLYLLTTLVIGLIFTLPSIGLGQVSYLINFSTTYFSILKITGADGKYCSQIISA
jgi:hypothetical protein